MQVINYDSLIDIPISELEENQTGGKVTPGVFGVDNEKINGSTAIYNMPEGSGGSIAGWTTNVTWGNPTNKKITRSAGYIYLPDGSALPVTAGNVDNMSGVTYIYYDMSDGTVYSTTVPQDAVGKNKLTLCVAKPVNATNKKAEFQAFGTDAQSQFVTADVIAANTITANEIASNTITSNELSVSQLSAISADMGTITSGTITGATVRTASSGTRFQMTSSEIAYYYGTKKRVEFTGNGLSFYDTSGNSTVLYGANGHIVTNGDFGTNGDLITNGDLRIDGTIFAEGSNSFLGSYSYPFSGAYIFGNINLSHGYITTSSSNSQIQYNDGNATRYLLASNGSTTSGSASVAGRVDVRIGGYWYKLCYTEKTSA